jgi:predicted Co/Zn/Cd cation transporter (cation efflux family)
LGRHEIAIYVDPVVAIFIGGYIMINPLKLAKEAYRHLLDAAPDPQFKRKAFSIAKKVTEESEFSISNVKITQSGRFIFVDIYLALPEKINLKKVIAIKSQIQQQLKSCFSQYKLKVYIVI